MNTHTLTTGIPADILADGEAVIESLMTGRPLDPEISRRIDERAERITEEIRRTHGIVDIAVPSIRELRDA
jgi:hypothetical protein